MNKNKSHIVVIVLAVLIIIASGYFLFSNSKQNTFNSEPAFEYTTNTPSASDQNVATTTELVLLPNDQYELFIQSEYDKRNNYFPKVQYKEAGKVESGKYAGFNRLVASVEYDEPGGPTIYVFATNDYKSFVLDKDSASYYDQDQNINKSKISSIDVVSANFPETIPLSNFILVKKNIDLNPTFSASEKLPDLVPGFSIYTNKPNSTNGDDYISGSSDVYLQDKNLIATKYSLMTAEEYSRAKDPESYDYKFYKSTDIVTSKPIYKEYGKFSPSGCGSIDNTYVLKDISIDDLSQIGKTVKGTELYILKDPNHSLNKNQYDKKVTVWKDAFFELNNSATPSYQDYLSKNPVLIFKDSLGRWIALGEWEYQTGGGCGKPVIYLYPENPTEVSVKLLNSMNFSVDIPTYAGGWNVLAKPDGSLVDLKPEKTDCNKINSNLEGSEYFKNACKENNYPYLYWAGYTTNAYPIIKDGWIVNSDDLESFLDKKLTDIRLNEKEKADFLEYWIPKILSKNSTYYRLSFLQTSDMNKFVPMYINPKPDTIFRIFLDWEPLGELPSDPIKPQVLNSLIRKGFTVVEWGGINK